jgi:rhodanese-related sulfurtransferase
MNASLNPQTLNAELGRFPGPLVIDLRRAAVFAEALDSLPGAIRRDPALVAEWSQDLEIGRQIVVACVHCHEVSQGACAALVAQGFDARYLEGGIEGWREASLPMAGKPKTPTLWVTRERPKIDRIACPWLIRRFIDPDAQFLYVPAGEVARTAEQTGAIPYDVPGVEFSHVGDHCSFDAVMKRYELTDPALKGLAEIVRGADTAQLGLTPQSSGLFAISLGLSHLFADDHRMLKHGWVRYDALYAWVRSLQNESHNWPPVMPRTGVAA